MINNTLGDGWKLTPGDASSQSNRRRIGDVWLRYRDVFTEIDILNRV
jgi:hypothetical protein